MAKKDSKPRRSGLKTVSIGGGLALLRAAFKTAMGAADRHKAGEPVKSIALKAVDDMAYESIGVMPALGRSDVPRGFHANKAVESGAWALGGAAGAKLAQRTGINKALVRAQRLLGMKKAYKL